MMACLTALWDLGRKPQIPMSTRQKASHSCYSSRGKQTCMSPNETRPDSPVETAEEPLVPCQHWRGTLRFCPQLQMRTSAPEASAEESREAPHKSHGDWTFLRQQEQVPDIPVINREEPQVCCRISRNTRRFSPHRKMRTFSPAASRGKSHLPS